MHMHNTNINCSHLNSHSAGHLYKNFRLIQVAMSSHNQLTYHSIHLATNYKFSESAIASIRIANQQSKANFTFLYIAMLIHYTYIAHWKHSSF